MGMVVQIHAKLKMHLYAWKMQMEKVLAIKKGKNLQ